MRQHFDNQLNLLKIEVIKMSTLCDEAIDMAIDFLFLDKKDLITKIDLAENQIEAKEKEIEILCMKLLLQQQPVAKDLRFISSTLKIVSNLERIGDQANNLAEITLPLELENELDTLKLKEMIDVVKSMLKKTIDAFINEDLDLAKEVIEQDNVADDLFNNIKEQITNIIQDHNSKGKAYIDILFIAKYLEKIGDYATAISYNILYIITGKTF